jgi:hypothetical protein
VACVEVLLRRAVSELQIFTTAVQRLNQGTLPQQAVFVAAVLFGSFLDKQKGTKKGEHLRIQKNLIVGPTKTLNICVHTVALVHHYIMQQCECR